jgi:hypothetical protein
MPGLLRKAVVEVEDKLEDKHEVVEEVVGDINFYINK